MLGKLTKHEIISSGRLLLPMNLALICASIIGKFFIWISSKEVFLASVPEAFSKIVRAISSLFTVLYVLLIFVVLIATILFLIFRFYKNYYTDEGYLMLTLPVKSKSLIISKLLSALVWTFISCSVVIASFALIMNTEETSGSFKMLWQETSLLLRRMAPEMNISFGVLITEIILVVLIAIIAHYLMFYTAIATGHSFTGKNTIIGSIISFVVIQIISQVISGAVLYALSNVMPNFIEGLNNNSGQALQSTIVVTGVLNLIFCTAYLLITDHLMKTKINLD